MNKNSNKIVLNGDVYSSKHDDTFSTTTSRVLDRLKHVDVRTSGRKNFDVQAPFAGRMPYFTVIRPIITVHNIVHINCTTSCIQKSYQYSLQARKSTPYMIMDDVAAFQLGDVWLSTVFLTMAVCTPALRQSDVPYGIPDVCLCPRNKIWTY